MPPTERALHFTASHRSQQHLKIAGVFDAGVFAYRAFSPDTMKIPGLGKHTLFSEKLFLRLQSGHHSQQWAGTKSRMRLLSQDKIQYEAPEPGQNPTYEAPEPGPNPGSATIRKHDFCVISKEIYSLGQGVCCKALALAASALATSTYVSAMTGYGHTELFKVTCYNFQPSRAC